MLPNDADESRSDGKESGDSEQAAGSSRPQVPRGEVIWVWGIPFAPLTLAESKSAIAELVEARKPSFVITANTHYGMVTEDYPEMREINAAAALILADGAPVIWASRLAGSPLPERVAGSDLIFELCQLSADKGYRMFFLGGNEGVAVAAAQRLTARYPGLQIVGTECPPFREPTPEEEADLINRIRATRPDILLVAFGQPKGERWIYRHLQKLEIPVCMQVGASLDFAAGRIQRAPRWMQKVGLEWAFRLAMEPKRLFQRYARNAWFLLRMIPSTLRQSHVGGGGQSTADRDK